MPQEIKKEANNRIFIYAFLGALLFAAAFGFTIANLSSIAALELSYTLVACLLTISSLSLLTKAIKRDKQRLASFD